MAQPVSLSYDDFSDVSALQINANAAVSGTGSGAVLRLTPSVQWQRGSAFTTTSIGLLNQNSFSTAFSFRFTAPVGGGGEGIVFVIQPTASTAIGANNGGMGYADMRNSMGIEFDTWGNGSLYGEGGGNTSHIGIQLNGYPHSHATQSTLGAPLNADMENGEIWYAWVDYDGTTDLLEARLSRTPDRPATANVSHTVDLVTELGQTSAFAGFTSATGAPYAIHDVLTWQFRNDYNPYGFASTLTAMPSSFLIWPLDALTISFDATNADGLYSFAADYNYDSGRLDYVTGSYAAGTLFSSGSPDAASLDFPTAPAQTEVTSGRNDGTGATGDGSVGTMSYTAKDFAEPGTATLSVSNIEAYDPAGAPFTFSDVFNFSVEIGGVWPGDANNDCTVDGGDHLTVSAKSTVPKLTGPARPAPRDFSWGAKAFSPWGGSSAHADFPNSFADTDGDGEIDVADRTAVRLNVNETHAATSGCPLPAASEPLAIALAGGKGETVAFEIGFDGSVDDLMGVFAVLSASGATILDVEAGTLLADADPFVYPAGEQTGAAFARTGIQGPVAGSGTLVRVLAHIDDTGASVFLHRFQTMNAAAEATETSPTGGTIRVSEQVAVAAADGVGALLDVALAPNPARHAATISVQTAEAGPATVALFDALGREVASVRRDVPAGSTAFDLPVGSLAPGVYVVRVTAPAGVVTRTLTVAR